MSTISNRVKREDSRVSTIQNQSQSSKMIWTLVALLCILITAMLVMDDIPLSLGNDQEPFTEAYSARDITSPSASAPLSYALHLHFPNPTQDLFHQKRSPSILFGRIRQTDSSRITGRDT